MAQNLISHTISPEAQAQVTQALNALDEAFTFQVTLTPKQKKKLTSPGETYLPLIDKSIRVVDEFPKALPGTFDSAEFKRDYELRQALIPIRNRLVRFTESIDNTLFAATSDCYVQALQVYAAVQVAVDKIPGINQLAAEMAEFFKKAAQDDEEETPPVAPQATPPTATPTK